MIKLLKLSLKSLILLSVLTAVFHNELRNMYVNKYLVDAVEPFQVFIPARNEAVTVGTAFQVKYNGKQYTVTNIHVCSVKLPDVFPLLLLFQRDRILGKIALVDGQYRRIIGVSTENDVCVLEPDLRKPALEISDRQLSFGDIVTLIGFPRGLAKVVRHGAFIENGKDVAIWLDLFKPIEYSIISTTTYPGNSGSPVVDYFGNLVGILFAGFPGAPTEGLMVPVEYLRDLLIEMQQDV